jgi:hypothetical protein
MMNIVTKGLTQSEASTRDKPMGEAPKPKGRSPQKPAPRPCPALTYDRTFHDVVIAGGGHFKVKVKTAQLPPFYLYILNGQTGARLSVGSEPLWAHGQNIILTANPPNLIQNNLERPESSQCLLSDEGLWVYSEDWSRVQKLLHLHSSNVDISSICLLQ